MFTILRIYGTFQINIQRTALIIWHKTDVCRFTEYTQ